MPVDQGNCVGNQVCLIGRQDVAQVPEIVKLALARKRLVVAPDLERKSRSALEYPQKYGFFPTSS